MADKFITLFPAAADLQLVGAGEVGLLFECAPDGAASVRYPGAVPLSRLIGDFESTKVKAYALARKLLRDEPRCRGLQQLAVFEEVVIRDLQRALHLLELHEFLVGEGFQHCHFAGYSDFAGGLAVVAGWMDSGLSVTLPAPGQRSSVWASLRRSWQRARSAGFSRRAVAKEWRQVLERLDPYHRRARVLPEKLLRKHGAVWFYSTAHTFTRIGLYYEPYFPQPFEYMVENPLTGGEPLRLLSRPFTSIYAFGRSDMEPSAGELREAQQKIVEHLKNVELLPDEAVARKLFLGGDFFNVFLGRHLSKGLYASALFDNWASTVRPKALVVGNPVFESYALQAARRHGIPTVLLQHGILGDYCQFSDPPVDHYVVRGLFWRDFLAAAPRARSLVLEPAAVVTPVFSISAHREAILFLTAPYSGQAFLHASDLDDILAALLNVASSSGKELIIRVHPLEEIGFYMEKVREWMRQNGKQARLTYSQGAGLDEVLRKAAVAVTYCSTAFLECLRHQVPIVSFAWHDFSFRRQIELHGVFNFAADLAELSRLVECSIQNELPAYAHSTRPFLADTPHDGLRTKLAELVENDSPQEQGSIS